jgi:hypothetical protein
MAILHAISPTLLTIGGLFSKQNKSSRFDCYSSLKLLVKAQNLCAALNEKEFITINPERNFSILKNYHLRCRKWHQNKQEK